jgi:hypothetical protein
MQFGLLYEMQRPFEGTDGDRVGPGRPPKAVSDARSGPENGRSVEEYLGGPSR